MWERGKLLLDVGDMNDDNNMALAVAETTHHQIGKVFHSVSVLIINSVAFSIEACQLPVWKQMIIFLLKVWRKIKELFWSN